MWHTESWNVKVGDIVLVKDRNAMRGDWLKGIIIEALPSGDQVQGPVQRITVLAPVEERWECIIFR